MELSDDSGNVSFDQFAGSKACAKCHKEIYDSFLVTGHFMTSELSDTNNVKGSFQPGQNIFHYTSALYVAMENQDSGLYQVEYKDGKKILARRFDITIGSGMRGQTYLSWQDDELTQLPVSYLTSAHSWANSPGDLNHVYFDRPINSRCLECHTTYAKVIPFRLANTPEAFEHKKIIYGISCEKCHGPGEKHVEFQTEHPEINTARYIVNPQKFSRQQSLDLCSLCHGGRIQSVAPTFSFQAGDTLRNYFKVSVARDTSIDVHGNQLGLLAQSKCFRTSSLTCLSCHNPHNNERGNLALYSARCMVCHNKEHGNFCTIQSDKVKNISANCIDCHMPKEVSKSIVLQLQNQKIPTAQLLRTHFIAVYPDATKKFIASQNATAN